MWGFSGRFFWGGSLTAYGISVSWPGIEPGPQQWKLQILTTRSPKNSPEKVGFVCFNWSVVDLSIVLVSAAQQSDSIVCVYTHTRFVSVVCVYIHKHTFCFSCVYIHTHTYMFVHFLRHGLSQDLECSSLYSTAGPCCLPILYTVVCIR